MRMIIYLRLSKAELEALDRLAKANGVFRHVQIQNMVREESRKLHLIEDNSTDTEEYDEK